MFKKSLIPLVLLRDTSFILLLLHYFLQDFRNILLDILHPTSQLLLPVHLIKKVFCSQEEVINLAALLVSLSCVVDPQLRLRGQELTDVGYGKHYLLHGAILTHNLKHRGSNSHSEGL